MINPVSIIIFILLLWGIYTIFKKKRILLGLFIFLFFIFIKYLYSDYNNQNYQYSDGFLLIVND